MPQKTKKHHRSKKTKKTQKQRSSLILAGVFLLALTIIAIVFLAYSSYHEHTEAGQLGVTDAYPGQNLAHSLDLKLAAKASYPSSEIIVTRDLSSSTGLRKKEFSFDVETDNLIEHGLMVLPATPKPANGYPVLILLHGFSSPSDYETDQAYLSDMEFYARNGFAVLKPDLRGLGLSKHAGHPDSAYFSMAYNTDVLSLITATKQTPYLDRANISLWGHSMGAYLALRAAVLAPGIKNIILLAAPVDSLTKMYLTYLPPSDSHNPYAMKTRNDVFAKYHAPDDDRFWYDSSPINFVSQIKAYVQIHVATNDGTVPPEFSADLDAALTKAYVPHQYFVYADGRHSLFEDRTPIYQRSLALLQGRPAD